MRTLRQFTLSSLALLSLAVAACKSSDVDVRDAKTGTYDMSYSMSLKNQTTGQTAADISSGLITVTKGNAANELIFADGDTYPVTMKGNDFSIPKYVSKQTIAGNSYAFDVVGFGTITDVGMTINYTMTGRVNNNNLLITYSGNGPKK